MLLLPVWQARRYITLLCALVYLIPSIFGRHQIIVHCVALLQEGAESRVHAESRLQSFTNKLRHAILHNADVASMWRPAAHMLDVKATLDRKLSDQWSAGAASQVAACFVFHSSTLCHTSHHFVSASLPVSAVCRLSNVGLHCDQSQALFSCIIAFVKSVFSHLFQKVHAIVAALCSAAVYIRQLQLRSPS